MKHTKYFLLLLLLFTVAFAPETEKIKVACVGDSITFGYGLEGPEKDNNKRIELSYPNQLRLLLDQYYPDQYQVDSFAVPGATILDNSGASFWDKQQYQNAINFKPDIVIIKFGTNDASFRYWTEGNGKSQFYDKYVEFINTFKSANPNAAIYICYPIPLFTKNSEPTPGQKIRLLNEVIPLIKKVALDTDAHLIDLHSVFYNGLNRGLIMNKGINGNDDKIHPNAAGAKLIAEEVFKVLKMNF